jgi:hypothetical protein
MTKSKKPSPLYQTTRVYDRGQEGEAISEEGTARPMLPGNLLRAQDVALLLNIDRRRIYELPIPRYRLSERSTRWLFEDVLRYVTTRREV